jgi:glycosyltransferase involved in cell wall biosynthesis
MTAGRRKSGTAPLRVLILANHFPKPGNPKLGIWALRQARALQRAGVEVTVCSLNEWVPRFLGPLVRRSSRLRRLDAWASCPPAGRMDGIEVHWPRWPRHHRWPHKNWFFAHPRLELGLCWPWARRRVLEIVDNARPDVIYAQGGAVNGWIASRIASQRGIPYVLQEIDVNELRAARDLPDRAAHYRAIGRGASAWIVCGPQMVEDLRAIVPDRTPLLMPYGTDVVEPVPRDPEPKVVLCVCQMIERKLVPQLVRAFSRIADRHPGVELRLLGDGPDLPVAVQEAESRGLRERVVFLEREADALAEMARADVFALVGREEAFGVVYVEAMGAGCAVLCSDDAGVLGVVEPGRHLMTVSWRDEERIGEALDLLLSDPELRERLGEAGREEVLRSLTWDRHAAGLKSVLERAAAPGMSTGASSSEGRTNSAMTLSNDQLAGWRSSGT